ncbi:MAG: septum formation protein Maf [Candidatus Aenigmarchaeota archaeon]|nr:septum formation protein Maf [Candidatus Aenigmarchaeota archaeon]
MKLILASKSPRRKMILEKLGLDFDIVLSNVEEIEDENGNIEDTVKKNAELKANAVAKNNDGAVVIGADTLVEFNGKVLGQPKTKDDAREMIALLSGETHFAVTGICVLNTKTGEKIIDISKTLLRLRALEDYEIDDYINSGAYCGKAGAYNITDDFAIRSIERLEGSYTNVVGLPTEKLIPILKKFGIKV